MRNRQLELFLPPEPPPMAGSAVLEFDLVLKDNSTVSIRFDREYFISASHIEFRGDTISSTGYFSHFPGYVLDSPDEEVIESIRTFAERLREERLAEIAKEARREKRKLK